MRISKIFNLALFVAAFASLPEPAMAAEPPTYEAVQKSLKWVAERSRVGKSEAELAAAAGRALRADQASSIANLPPDPPATSDQLMGEYRLAADRMDAATATRLAKVMVEAAIAATGDEGQFLSIEDVHRLTEKSAAVGIALKMDEGQLTVVRLPAGSALQGQLQTGERITAINGQPTAGQSLDWATEQLRGAIGSEVELTVMSSSGETRKVAAQRKSEDELGIGSSIWGNIGYVRLDSCQSEDPRLVREHVERLKKLGATSFILDLRHNPGGLLDAVIGVADLYLTKGEILSELGRDPMDIERFYAKPDDILDGARLILLVGPETGNGAEAVVRALQHHRRALVVGEPTAGKAIVRSAAMVSAEFLLMLPTADLRGPDNKPITGHPVEPDVVIHNVNPGRDSQLEGARLIASTQY